VSKQILTAVLEKLPSLSPSERDEVLARIMLLGVKQDVTKRDSVYQVYLAVAELVGRGFPPVSQARRSYRFERGCRRLQEYIDGTCGNVGRKRPQIIRLLVDCVLADMKQIGLKVGPQILGDRMMDISGVVDRCYPGYVASGILVKALLHERLG
jgi:hypothetical protein